MRARFVTLNMWGDRAPLDARIAAAAAALKPLAPDVVFLQEVREGDGLPNTAVDLATKLGGRFRVTYAPATTGPAGTWGPGSGAGAEGLAILTSHPMSGTTNRELPDSKPTERRILLSARVDVWGTPVWCHTTHLHWRLSDGVARERQVAAIDETTRDLGGAGTDLHVLAGDFNAAPDCDEIRFLRGRHTLAGRRTVWQDAYATVHGQAADGERGVTWARRNPMTDGLAWLDRDRRIDYIFVSPERARSHGRVLDARVALDQPDAAGVWPSDHFAVLADVELGER